jgi:hypothetical protein
VEVEVEVGLSPSSRVCHGPNQWSNASAYEDIEPLCMNLQLKELMSSSEPMIYVTVNGLFETR